MENAAFDSSDENKGNCILFEMANYNVFTILITDGLSKDEKPVPEALELKRKVGLFSACALVVGNMIGSLLLVNKSPHQSK